MFEKISKKKFKWLIWLKYFFQFIIAPVIMGLIFNIFTLIFLLIRGDGFSKAISELFVENISGVSFSFSISLLLIAFFFNIVNILSVLPFIKLSIDCFTKNDENIKEIELVNFLPFYELQCIRQSKRFMCDTFSRKENAELFLYDENKNKYRLFWNEKYGDKEKLDEVLNASRIKISYFKHSKIIFNVEVLEHKNLDY